LSLADPWDALVAAVSAAPVWRNLRRVMTSIII
jgi:hypothetical protein